MVETDIERLNALVLKITDKIAAAADANVAPRGKHVGRPLDSRDADGDESAVGALPAEVDAVRAGNVTVYHHRWRSVVWAIVALSLAGLTRAPSVLALAGWAFFFYLYVDLYGALLHVVLDNPAFINVPGIDAGCLEFQWHHHIPWDICSKPFMDVLGDLNAAAAFHFVFVFGVLQRVAGWQFDGELCLMMIGLKCAFAYLGQFSHRMAHMPSGRRPPLVAKLQAWGILLPPKTHAAHHATYDGSFAILNGWSNPLVAGALRVAPWPLLWLATFVVFTMFDVVACTYAHQWLAAHANFALGEQLSLSQPPLH